MSKKPSKLVRIVDFDVGTRKALRKVEFEVQVGFYKNAALA
jgi:hypothetical protein